MMERCLTIAIALLVLLASVPAGLAHEGEDSREDPEGDFAKKPERNGLDPFAGEPYAGAPCPVTDILSVQTEAVHTNETDLPGNATLAHFDIADLTIDPSECPLFTDTNTPFLYYGFTVRPANEPDEVKVRTILVWEDDAYWKVDTSVKWHGNSGSFGFDCSICLVSLDQEAGSLTLALPEITAEPPYRHVNAYAVSSTCLPAPLSPVPALSTCISRGLTSSSHADVVPNLGEGEWSLYTDDEAGPVGRLVDA